MFSTRRCLWAEVRLSSRLLSSVNGAIMDKIRRRRCLLAFYPTVMLKRTWAIAGERPNKGFRVVPISKDHLMDVMNVRTEIEVLCLGWSIDQGGVEWESSLVGALHRLKRFSKTAVPSASSSDDWRTAHRAFHSALISACGSELLKSFHSGLFDQVERYIAISVGITDQPRDDISEHEGLVQAALDRHTEEAVVLLRQHHMRTLHKLVTQLFGPEGAAQKGARGKPTVKSAGRGRSTTLDLS